MEKDDGVLVLRRIHVLYRLKVPPGKWQAAERVHDIHHRYCPVYRTLSGCVNVTTELEMEEIET